MKKLNYNSVFQIDNTFVGLDKPAYFIADIAANHDGSLTRAKELIWAAKEAGANAAKFQHFSAKTIVSDKGFKDLGSQKSHQSEWKKSVFEVYDEASLNLDWTNELKETCDKAKITFFTSPYSLEIVDQVDSYVPAYKIGSGDITWIDIIKHIASKDKPYIIATGASNIIDVERAINAGLEINKNIAILQCNTNYTGSVENMKYINLNVIKNFQTKYPGMIIGLSDHTPGHATVLGAIALGAKIVEKHFTDDTSREGPDHLFSMNPKTWRDMIDRSRELEAALGKTEKKIEGNEFETVILQRRSIRANKHLKKGSIIKKSDLEVLRPIPKDALPPYEIDNIIGRETLEDIKKGDCIFLRQVEVNEK
ncbi:N-acetylneuraminate synthase family protein [Candidatus Pelagibacter sp. HIMB1695]|uniref:N-acetylneuraminate synthase family protein n=1 Tax=Candidatus Pelagibacter sp. HIMB1695 TaxID=3413364 RepID=UPI003F87D031